MPVPFEYMAHTDLYGGSARKLLRHVKTFKSPQGWRSVPVILTPEHRRILSTDTLALTLDDAQEVTEWHDGALSNIALHKIILYDADDAICQEWIDAGFPPRPAEPASLTSRLEFAVMQLATALNEWVPGSGLVDWHTALPVDVTVSIGICNRLYLRLEILRQQARQRGLTDSCTLAEVLSPPTPARCQELCKGRTGPTMAKYRQPWTPKRGYVGVNAVSADAAADPKYARNGKHPRRSVIQNWEKKPEWQAAKDEDPATHEAYYPEGLWLPQLDDWARRQRTHQS